MCLWRSGMRSRVNPLSHPMPLNKTLFTDGREYGFSPGTSETDPRHYGNRRVAQPFGQTGYLSSHSIILVVFYADVLDADSQFWAIVLSVSAYCSASVVRNRRRTILLNAPTSLPWIARLTSSRLLGCILNWVSPNPSNNRV